MLGKNLGICGEEIFGDEWRSAAGRFIGRQANQVREWVATDRYGLPQVAIYLCRQLIGATPVSTSYALKILGNGMICPAASGTDPQVVTDESGETILWRAFRITDVPADVPMGTVLDMCIRAGRFLDFATGPDEIDYAAIKVAAAWRVSTKRIPIPDRPAVSGAEISGYCQMIYQPNRWQTHAALIVGRHGQFVRKILSGRSAEPSFALVQAMLVELVATIGSRSSYLLSMLPDGSVWPAPAGTQIGPVLDDAGNRVESVFRVTNVPEDVSIIDLMVAIRRIKHLCHLDSLVLAEITYDDLVAKGRPYGRRCAPAAANHLYFAINGAGSVAYATSMIPPRDGERTVTVTSIPAGVRPVVVKRALLSLIDKGLSAKIGPNVRYKLLEQAAG